MANDDPKVREILLGLNIQGLPKDIVDWQSGSQIVEDLSDGHGEHYIVTAGGGIYGTTDKHIKLIFEETRDPNSYDRSQTMQASLLTVDHCELLSLCNRILPGPNGTAENPCPEGKFVPCNALSPLTKEYDIPLNEDNRMRLSAIEPELRRAFGVGVEAVELEESSLSITHTDARRETWGGKVVPAVNDYSASVRLLKRPDVSVTLSGTYNDTLQGRELVTFKELSIIKSDVLPKSRFLRTIIAEPDKDKLSLLIGDEIKQELVVSSLDESTHFKGLETLGCPGCGDPAYMSAMTAASEKYDNDGLLRPLDTGLDPVVNPNDPFWIDPRCYNPGADYTPGGPVVVICPRVLPPRKCGSGVCSPVDDQGRRCTDVPGALLFEAGEADGQVIFKTGYLAAKTATAVGLQKTIGKKARNGKTALLGVSFMIGAKVFVILATNDLIDARKEAQSANGKLNDWKKAHADYCHTGPASP
jgi:hypothetical protein